MAGSDEVAHELLARVDHVAVERAEPQRLALHDLVVLARLAEVDGQRDHLGRVLVLDPLEHHARVQPAGVEQQHARDLVAQGEVGGHPRGVGIGDAVDFGGGIARLLGHRHARVPAPAGPAHPPSRGSSRHVDEELVDLPHDLDEAVEVDRLGHVGVRVQLVGAHDVLLRREVESTTTGIRRSASSPLISARTSRPSLRGRLRSSRIRPGRGAAANVALAAQEAQRLDPVGHRVQAVAQLVVRERLPDQQDVAGIVLDQQDVDRPPRCSSGVLSWSMAGRVRQKVVPPSSGGGPSQIRPPWYSTILRHIARPMPVPS